MTRLDLSWTDPSGAHHEAIRVTEYGAVVCRCGEVRFDPAVNATQALIDHLTEVGAR